MQIALENLAKCSLINVLEHYNHTIRNTEKLLGWKVRLYCCGICTCTWQGWSTTLTKFFKLCLQVRDSEILAVKNVGGHFDGFEVCDKTLAAWDGKAELLVVPNIALMAI
jgi:hypothetical protein